MRNEAQGKISELVVEQNNSTSYRSISIVQLNTLLCFKQAEARFSFGKSLREARYRASGAVMRQLSAVYSSAA